MNTLVRLTLLKLSLIILFLTFSLLILGTIAFLQPRWLFKLILKIAPGVNYFAETHQPIIALTIDDGPDSKTTAKILDVLTKHQASATFFLIGERTQGNEEIITNIIQGGHEIGNHMMRDEKSINLGINDFEEQFLQAHVTLTKLLNNNQIASQQNQPSQIQWFRPGGGWYNSDMIGVAEKYQYKTALGSIFPYDTHIPSSKFAAYQILVNLRPGAIIVLHDSSRDGKSGEWGERTVSTLNTILPEIKRRGYQTVTLSEMFTVKGS